MKIFKSALHYWIAIVSVSEFPGWLGHAGTLSQAGPGCPVILSEYRFFTGIAAHSGIWRSRREWTDRE